MTGKNTGSTKTAKSASALKSAPKPAVAKPGPQAGAKQAGVKETPAPKSPPAQAPRPAPIFVPETASDTPGAEMKKKELIDKVVRRAEVKKKFAKPVVEAMLEILGEAVNEGRELNLQPFGRLKHNRTRETGKARVAIVKIRQPRAQIDPLVEKADDD